MKLVFFGTPEFAVPSLKILHESPQVEILKVITQPDRPIGRKQILQAPPVKEAALKMGLTVIQPHSTTSIYEELQSTQCDFFIVIAYGMILDKKILEIPKLCAINVHASLLPKYRGASPIQSSLLNGDIETGISIMQMDEKLDHGDVFFMKKTPILPNETSIELSKKLAKESGQILPLILEDIYNGELKPIPQVHSQATYCKKIAKNDGEIDWNKSAREIMNMFKAYQPWPGIFTKIADKKIQLLEFEIGSETLSPGEYKIKDKELLIGTSKGVIKPQKVQISGKTPMKIENFLNGYKSLILNPGQKD